MMMAYDSSPTPPRTLDGETVASIRAALGEYVERRGDGDTLRGALHRMAAEAREKGIQPEHLLIVLKQIWHGLPTVRDEDEPANQIRLLQRVVTMCIKEYYGA